MKHLLPLLGICLLLAPVAAAQEPGAFSLDVSDAAATAFTPGQATEIPVSVTVGCDVILGGAGADLDVAITTDLPAAWGASGDTITVEAGPACITSMTGAVTGSGTVTVNPSMDVLALNATAFTITATAGEETDTFAFPASWVAYVPGHTISTNVTFPYNFTEADGGALEFTLTLDVAGNADTMIMFESISSSGGLSGLAHQFYYPTKGDFERTKTLNVIWTPPARDWESDNITFTNYSHCLTGDLCDPDTMRTNTTTYTWQITNGVQSKSGGGGDDKGSPGVGSVLLLAGLVAAAFVARRR